MAETAQLSAPPQGVTLDAPQSSAPPEGITLGDPVPADVTLDAPAATPATPAANVDTRTFRDPSSFGDLMYNEGLGMQDLKDAINRQLVGPYGATTAKLLRAIPGVGDVIAKHTNLDAQIADLEALRAKPYPTDPDRAKDQEAIEHLENVAEFMTLTGMAKQGLTFLGSVKATAPIISALEKSPVIARILSEGLSQASAAGAQTKIHGGTNEEALTNAALSGVIGGGLEAQGPLMDATMSKIESMRAQPRTIAGATFETMPKTGDLLARSMRDITQDPATLAADEALGNIGKTAVARSAARSNLQRPTGMSRILAEDRRLPAPAGSAQGFAVGRSQPAETTPIKEGEILLPARKRQIGTRAVEGKGSPTGVPEYSGTGFRGEEAPPPPSEVAEPPTQRGSHREPVFQYLSSARPGTPPAVEGETGPGVIFLTKDGQAASVPRMRQQIARYDRIMDDPEIWDELTQRDQNAIKADHADLTEQLHRYDDYAAAQPHFRQMNPQEMVRNTDSIGDAAAQLKEEHGKFWDVADEISHKEFSDLRDEEKRLRKQIFGETPTGRLDELRQQLKLNQQAQLDFFDRFRTRLSPEEWKIAREGYQDGIVLQNLDDMFQQKFRGITRAEEQRGIAEGTRRQREFKPGEDFAQQLENFYNDGYRDSATNRQVLERTIGQKHMDDLKDLSLLFRDAQRREATASLARSVTSAVTRHYHGIKGILAAGGGAGMMFAHSVGAGLGIAGTPLMTGTVAGVRNYVVEQLLTNPQFARRFTYSVKNGVPPRTAGALLASHIIGAQIVGQSQNEPGNIDLRNRPVVKNDDGTTSTEYSTSMRDTDGREVLVPTIVDGKFLTPDGKKPPEGSEAEKHMFRRAWAHYKTTGEHLGKFRTAAEADAYAKGLHNSREAEGRK